TALSLHTLFTLTAPSTPALYTLSLHDALPIYPLPGLRSQGAQARSPHEWFKNTLSIATGNTTPKGGVLFPSILSRVSSHSNETRSEEHTSELQSRFDLVCRLLLEKKKKKKKKR